MRTRDLRLRLAGLIAAAFVLASSLPVSAATPTYNTSMPLPVWEVPLADLAKAKSYGARLVVKAFSPGMNVVKYLDTAGSLGLKVVVYFTDTVNYGTGTVYPSRVGSWVIQVRTHSALYGYLSVKEPSWHGITLAEMRSLYAKYRSYDTKHRVIALLGDVPHFGTSANPWGTGVANMLWVDWYPVTYSKGYIATASTHFPKVRAYVDKVTPGTPIWLMVQGHGYRAGDRRTPTPAEFERQVRDGLTYLKANGVIFYTWNNALYDMDLRRNPTLCDRMKSIISRIRAGTF